ncbi:MAG: hypothetical protein ACYC69_14145 [Thermodesulfovibrionales bacterium]
MFIRFIVNEKHVKSTSRLGIFHAIRYLRDDGELTDDELREMDQVMEWFADHMEAPDRLSRTKAISWFKDSPKEHISNIRKIVAVLRTHDIEVEMVRTDKPGYLVYEDDYQIFAEPFSETLT